MKNEKGKENVTTHDVDFSCGPGGSNIDSKDGEGNKVQN